MLLLGLGTSWDGKERRMHEGMEEQKHLLDIALKRGIPVLCCNPDRVVVKPSGLQAVCPGTLAAYYEENGGRVLYCGKPYPEVYEMCVNLALAEKTEEEAVLDESTFPAAAATATATAAISATSAKLKRAVAVGDSLHHDIAGALAAGINSVFVCGGVHAVELGIAAASAEVPVQADLDAIYKQHLGPGRRPSHAAAAFTW